MFIFVLLPGSIIQTVTMTAGTFLCSIIEAAKASGFWTANPLVPPLGAL